MTKNDTKKLKNNSKEVLKRSTFVPVEVAEELMQLLKDLTGGKGIVFDED